MIRYVLAVLVPPASVCGTGCYTAPPIAVFWLAALSTLYLVPEWTPVWLGLAAFFWLAATTWAVLSLRGTEADAGQDRESTRKRHVDPEQNYPGEDQIPHT
ncbi:hypothetical protein [Thiohalorhabdus sp.]|uniref:hypothetical protein n=1 Tax=Thiohalorhabdus sp. TaxID=3094134 RepID=UPI002FC388E9